MKKTIIAFVILFALLFFWDRLFKNQQKYKLTNTEEQPNYNVSKDNFQSTAFKKAPDFNLISLNNNEIKLSNYKDKIIILDFWATWCPPCRAEIPHFIELYKKYKEQGLMIIGVATSDEKYKVKEFVKNFKINYPVVMADEKILQNFGDIRGLPTTFIIDKEGNIREKFVGYRPKEVFEEIFLKLK